MLIILVKRVILHSISEILPKQYHYQLNPLLSWENWVALMIVQRLLAVSSIMKEKNIYIMLAGCRENGCVITPLLAWLFQQTMEKHFKNIHKHRCLIEMMMIPTAWLLLL